jgi:predicted DsbA family dithiol-disulfide isomerase
MLIDIFHDPVCPWCRIGKKHLFDALEQWQVEAVNIRWHAFLLDDTIPSQGCEFRSFMKSRKGTGTEELKRMFDYTQQVGEAAGVKLDFDKISLAVNTTLSHRLLVLALEKIKNIVVEAIYKAYFEDGLDIGSIDILVSIGKISLSRDISAYSKLGCTSRSITSFAGAMNFKCSNQVSPRSFDLVVSC